MKVPRPAPIVCRACGHFFGRSTDVALILGDGVLVITRTTLVCRCGAEREWVPAPPVRCVSAADERKLLRSGG